MKPVILSTLYGGRIGGSAALSFSHCTRAVRITSAIDTFRCLATFVSALNCDSCRYRLKRRILPALHLLHILLRIRHFKKERNTVLVKTNLCRLLYLPKLFEIKGIVGMMVNPIVAGDFNIPVFTVLGSKHDGRSLSLRMLTKRLQQFTGKMFHIQSVKECREGVSFCNDNLTVERKAAHDSTSSPSNTHSTLSVSKCSTT